MRTPAEIYADIRDVERQCVADLNAKPDEQATCLVYVTMYDRTAVLWDEMHRTVMGDPGTPMWAEAAACEMGFAHRAAASSWRSMARDAQRRADRSGVTR